MAELFVLDPAAVATGRTEVDITPFVNAPGPDFGDAQIEQFMAEMSSGQVPVDFRIPNRQVTIPLILTDWGGLTFAQIRRQVQAKTALFQREGGWVKRQTAEGIVYADVVGATLKLGADNAAAAGFADANAVLTLECLPDWYGDEIELDEISETTLPEITAVLQQDGQDAVIAGDYPGRCRIVVTEGSGTDQGAVLAAFRSRHYSADATAALAYEAEALTPMGAASITSISGASGGGTNNTVAHQSLSTAWTPVLLTTISATSSDLTHTGTYRVLARVRSSAGADITARLAWAVGDLNDQTNNPGWKIPTSGRWHIADLGQIRIDQTPAGAHRWLAQIQARGSTNSGNIYIDRVWFVPVDECSIRATTISRTDFEASPSVQDLFTQTSGNLNGKTATLGGNWATSGATTDFTVNTTNQTTQRTTTSDGAASRIALLGSTTFTGLLANVRVRTTGPYVANPLHALGVILRYVNSSNYAAVRLLPFYYQLPSRTGGGWDTFYGWFPELLIVIGGTTTTYDGETVGATSLTEWRRLRVLLYANGTINIWHAEGSNPFNQQPQLAMTIAELAATGTLATGKVGLVDYNGGVLAATREYDDFSVANVPTSPSSALYASQTIQLATDGVSREISGGGVYAAPPSVTGRLPRIPPSGIEERPVELFVKASRGDLAQSPDDGIDAVTAQVFYRPSYLFVSD